MNWRYLAGSDEAIWFSERNNWGNLYLYDLKTGKLKHPITTGDGNVTEVRARRSEDAHGVVPGRGPHAGRSTRTISSSGRSAWTAAGPTLLTPEPCDHIISMSPDGRYFVDSCSTPTSRRSRCCATRGTGAFWREVASADISRLKAAGWKPPQPITVKARDGKTDLYGLMFKPTNFDPRKKYPIIDYIYPGPQIGSVARFDFEPSRARRTRRWPSWASSSSRSTAWARRGAPQGFQRLWYGDMGDNTLPDQVAALKELGAALSVDRPHSRRHLGPFRRRQRHRGRDVPLSGFLQGRLGRERQPRQPQLRGRLGREVAGPAGDATRTATSNYDDQANELPAENLKGQLMLTHGTMDDNVPPANTLLVVEALIKANRTFDMIAIPNAHHGYG